MSECVMHVFPYFFQNNMETGCAIICHKICTDLLFSVCDSKRKDFFFQACHLCKWHRQRRFEIWSGWTQSFKVSILFSFHLQKWSSLSAVGKLLLLQIFNRTWKQWVFSQPRRNCLLVNICTTTSIRNLFRFALINYLNYLSSSMLFLKKICPLQFHHSMTLLCFFWFLYMLLVSVSFTTFELCSGLYQYVLWCPFMPVLMNQQKMEASCHQINNGIATLHLYKQHLHAQVDS